MNSKLFDLIACATCAAALTLTLPAAGAAEKTLLLADFNTTESIANAVHESQSRVFDVALGPTNDPIDKTQALRYTATMAGPDAGWASIRFDLPADTGLTYFDTIKFHGAGLANTRNIYLTLIDDAGTRWATVERLTATWNAYSVPVADFKWQSGNAKAEHDLRAALPNIKALELSFTNRFEGSNGIELDNVKIVSQAQPFYITAATTEPLTIPVQKPYNLLIEARDAATSAPANVAAQLDIRADDPQILLAPDRVELKDGKANIPLFLRRPGQCTLTIADEFSSDPLTLTATGIVEGVRVNTQLGSERNLSYGRAQMPTRYKVTVDNIGNLKPQTAHLAIRDNNGRPVVERIDTLRELATGRVQILLPTPGLYSAEVSILTDDPATLPTDRNVNKFQFKSPDKATADKMCAADLSPSDGVTTALCTGYITTFETLPTTATVVGRDRFPVVVIAPAAYENMKWGSPFGIAGTGLFALDKIEFEKEGKVRATWHNRLGSRWVRDDILRPTVEVWRGAYDWDRFDRTVLLYREAHLKLLASLTSPALWADGQPPATTEERALWRDWVRSMAEHAGSKVMCWEPWPESNTEDSWGKYPDPSNYRELMRSTWDGLRAAANEFAQKYQVVGGAVRGTDTIFFDTILASGFSKYLNIISFRPLPLRSDRSPEWNDFPLVLDTMGKAMERGGLITPQKRTEQWITSIGWDTGKGGASLHDQAVWLVRAYTIALSKKMDKIFWSNLVDDDTQTRGLMTAQWQPKPAAIAYNFMQYQLSQAVPRDVTRQGNAVIHNFDIRRHSMRWAGAISIAWTEQPGVTHQVIFKTKQAGCLAHDLFGAELPTILLDEKDTGGEYPKRTYGVMVGNDPVYLWDVGQPSKNRGTVLNDTGTSVVETIDPFAGTDADSVTTSAITATEAVKQ